MLCYPPFKVKKIILICVMFHEKKDLYKCNIISLIDFK